MPVGRLLFCLHVRTYHACDGTLVRESEPRIAELTSSVDELLRMRGTPEKSEITEAMQFGVAEFRGSSHGTSAEHALQKPPMSRRALAEDPQTHSAKIHSPAVIARDRSSIPPPGLDWLRIAEQTQSTLQLRPAFVFEAQLRHIQRPEWATCGRKRPAVRSGLPRFANAPGLLRPVIGKQLQSMHRLGAQARSQLLQKL